MPSQAHRSLTLLSLLLCLSLFLSTATAQFNIFEQMFGGGQQHQQQHHQQQQRQNMPSDASWYRGNWENAYCDKYLCPNTLSCVDKPAHCPCAWPAQEDKVELSDGLALCASKGGWKMGEMARKVELARKGLM